MKFITVAVALTYLATSAQALAYEPKLLNRQESTDAYCVGPDGPECSGCPQGTSCMTRGTGGICCKADGCTCDY
ncbi:uncharacterized protein F4822DRAFT_409144 [Hypoxylon trugodes]|uniref:uncharacterized protein n=1 Tax=Hypoxylon trugodes TaxID=326681 RepID=UPI00219BE566|nr:uncharacterized protein F4822DRAFT_409144 [Hypoxylon trugodes]KAI1386172.1 hypothetical protein F4822DRAFT_409144 [Hypoxylon trugodes]